MKLRKELLRRAIVDNPKPIHHSRRNGYTPKPTRFALEAEELLSIPPEACTPAPPEPRRRRSRKDRWTSSFTSFSASSSCYHVISVCMMMRRELLLNLVKLK